MNRIRLEAAFAFAASQQPPHTCRPDRVEWHEGTVPHRAVFCACGEQYGNSVVRPVEATWERVTVTYSWLRLTAVNGTHQWIWRCEGCRFGQAVKHAVVPAWVLNGSPGVAFEVKDNVDPTRPCERCGSRSGTEFHHYAPCHLFDDADRWATGYLCRGCHTEWHRKTQTGAFARRRIA